MVGSRGSLGLGIVHVAALYGTAALVRRWGEECRTIVATCSNVFGSSRKRPSNVKGNNSNTSRRSNNTKRREERYKKRRTQEKHNDDEESSSFSSSEDSDDPSTLVILTEDNDDDDDNTYTTEEHFIMAGLQMAQSLARAPCMPEFQSWSCEAREAVLDALTCALAVSSALTAAAAGGSGVGTNNNHNIAAAANNHDHPALQLCREVTVCISECLVMCACSRMDDDNDDDNDSSSSSQITSSSRRRSSAASNAGDEACAEAEEQDQDRKQEIIISVQRGLLKLLLMQGVEVPFGQKGRCVVCLLLLLLCCAIYLYFVSHSREEPMFRYQHTLLDCLFVGWLVHSFIHSLIHISSPTI